MTILAVCGPVGSDFKAFSEKCYSLLNKENTVLIDSSNYSSTESLLSAIQNTGKDVIIFGSDIFLNETLHSKFDVKVFLELDSDLCLCNYLKLSTLSLEDSLKDYKKQIKPINDKIRSSAKYAALRRPQSSANNVLIDLLINVETKSLKNINSSDSQAKDRFWRTAPQPQQVDSLNQNISNGH